MDQIDVHTARPLKLHARSGQRRGAIGRIVQHLNLQAIRRPVQIRRRVDDALDDAGFVIQRELHRHDGVSTRSIAGPIVLMPEY
jgi:hypothetical protein